MPLSKYRLMSQSEIPHISLKIPQFFFYIFADRALSKHACLHYVLSLLSHKILTTNGTNPMDQTQWNICTKIVIPVLLMA